ncbi:hypothetical protein IIA28_19020 [candidate division KSB1 bacterium]|nr:hypothetical protein [candidate division KSB1 bacterium]
MWDSFRKIGFVLAAIVISVAIYLTFYAEEEVKQSVLEYSLDLMGEKLLALVPDGTEKNKLTELYQDFKERATKGNVAPQQIESMAANILNTGNTETALTPQQAEGILRSAMLAPTPISELLYIELSPGEPPQLARAPKPERLQFVGKRVKTMFELNEKIYIAIKKNRVKYHEKARQIHYRVKDGLNIIMDVSLRSHLEEEEFKNLAEQLKALEQDRVLKWEKDLSVALEKEMAALQNFLDELKEQKSFEILKELESLKSLEHLKHIPVIDPDSIRKVVEKSLREAGIHSRKKPHE